MKTRERDIVEMWTFAIRRYKERWGDNKISRELEIPKGLFII